MTNDERTRLAGALNRAFRDPYPEDMERVRKGLIAWRARHVAEEMGWAFGVADDFLAGVMVGIDATVIPGDDAERGR